MKKIPATRVHLHAGYCDDMEYSGLADEVLGIVGEEVALPRHHGRGDRALVAADDRVDPLGEAIARLIDPSVEALAPARIARRAYAPDRAERRTDGADAGEERVASKVVAARQRRMRGRQQPRFHRHEIAGCDVGRLARGNADAARRLVTRHAVGADDRDHHARADRP